MVLAGWASQDERERVKKCGARVLSMDQIAGMEPIHENWGDVKLGEAFARLTALLSDAWP